VQRGKRTVSAAVRNRMAAAQRARWAKLKGQKQKAAARTAKKPVQKVQAAAA